jgi:hypothetical protein
MGRVPTPRLRGFRNGSTTHYRSSAHAARSLRTSTSRSTPASRTSSPPWYRAVRFPPRSRCQSSLGSGHRVHLYFRAAELLANVARHAEAPRASLSRAQHGSWCATTVGSAPRPNRAGSSSSGLAGLTDRVGAVDGHLPIASPPGGAPVITVDLPTVSLGTEDAEATPVWSTRGAIPTSFWPPVR